MQNQDDKKSKKPKLRVKWEDDIRNPENEEFVVETAFNLGKKPKKVTQDEFNQRYGVKYDIVNQSKTNLFKFKK